MSARRTKLRFLTRTPFGSMQQVEDLADRAMRFERMPQGLSDLQLIDVSSAILFHLEALRFGELGYDFLHHSFGDSYAFGHIPQANLRVLVDAPEDVRVIGQERPWRSGSFQERRCRCIVLGFLHGRALWQSS